MSDIVNVKKDIRSLVENFFKTEKLRNLFKKDVNNYIIKSIKTDNNSAPLGDYNIDNDILKYVYQECSDQLNLKCFLLDACYSTNLRKYKNLDYIVEFLNKQKTCELNKENINKIFNNLIDKNPKYFPFSFLTKYFVSFKRYEVLNQSIDLPIYDKYVQIFLDIANKHKICDKIKLKTSKNEVKKDIYDKFYEAMSKIKDSFNKENYGFDELDTSIWVTAKIIPILLDNLLDKDKNPNKSKKVLLDEFMKNNDKFNKKDDLIEELEEELKEYNMVNSYIKYLIDNYFKTIK